MMYLLPCRGLGQHGWATRRHVRVSSWMSYEVYNRFSKPVVRRADMSDGGYVQATTLSEAISAWRVPV